MSYEIIHLTTATEAAAWRERILEMAREIFPGKVSGELWDWAYLRNPAGAPVISLAVQAGQIAGHYAAIPQTIRGGSGELSPGLLSMTTMVRPESRRDGLFQILAEDTYTTAAALGHRFVFGFPNAQSLPGFRKRLAWSVDESLQLAEFNALGTDEHPTHAPRAVELPPHDWVRELAGKAPAGSPNMGDAEYLAWRLSRPGGAYACAAIGDDLLVLKKYGASLDVLFSTGSRQPAAGVIAFAQRLGFRTVTAYVRNPEVAEPGRMNVKPYPFGFRVFSKPTPELVPSLLMSDVF